MSRQSRLVIPLLEIWLLDASCTIQYTEKRMLQVSSSLYSRLFLCNVTLSLSCTLFLGLLFILGSSFLSLCLCEPVLMGMIELRIAKDDMNSLPLSTGPVLSCLAYDHLCHPVPSCFRSPMFHLVPLGGVILDVIWGVLCSAKLLVLRSLLGLYSITEVSTKRHTISGVLFQSTCI